jgi:superfamily II DNA/RNA helicase
MTKTTFDDLGLNPKLLQAVKEIGYLHPTPIQEEAIPYVLMGRDVLGIAQTGTGKTASFTLPMLEILGTARAKPRMPRALVLAPTRELAAQILENLNSYGKHTTLTAALMVGGDPMQAQTALLHKGVDILIATPGRLLDHILRSGLILTDVKFFVIDEADRMLDMGFIPDIEKIVKMLPKIRQTLMFTATMPALIKTLSAQFLQTPREISVSRQSSTGENITQEIYRTTSKNKINALYNLLRTLNPTSALVFCNRKIDVDKVKTALQQKNMSVVAMHGDMVQARRYENLEQFKSGEAKIIICSDVAARGIDIDDITHVFNYDLPHNPEDYVHRIGRTGRAGKSGHAITFVTEDDDKSLIALKKLIQQDLKEHIVQSDDLKAPTETPKQPLKKSRIVTEKKSEPKILKNNSQSKSDSSGFGDDVPSFMRDLRK